ncbi:MAG: hypothetical protein IJP81_10770 [Bacteroidales bacterium]|nr:hypothetical protein [Bacteroidales bacterium]
MKKVYSFILSGAAILAVAACNKETQVEDPAQNNGPVYETLSVKVGAETKVSLGEGATKSSFELGDNIAVWTDADEFQTCSVDGEGKITVDISGGARSNYAVYYNGATIPTYESSTLKITLPDTYNFADVAGTKNPVPMVAKNVADEAGDMTFYAVCALARIAVPGIPATADKLVVNFDMGVTGEFTVSNPGDEPSITAKTGSSTVTINLTPGTDYSGAVINIPVPVGTITASVQAKAEGTALETKPSVIKGWNAARAHGKKATAKFTPSMYSMVLAPGNLYTDGDGNLKISSTSYDHIYAFSSNGVYANDAETYSAKNRTHFNFNETYFLMKGEALDNTKAFTDQDTYDLEKSDISGGDFKTWRVPTMDEWINLIESNNRSGSKVRNGSGGEYESGWKYAYVSVSGMGTAGTSNIDGTYPMAINTLYPNTEYQAGLLLFPDNVEITGSFGDGLVKNKTNKFTKSTLDELITAGCAFLPAVGRWYNDKFEHVGTRGFYWACTKDSNWKHLYFYLDSGDYFTRNGGPVNCIRSVRLVRDLN